MILTGNPPCDPIPSQVQPLVHQIARIELEIGVLFEWQRPKDCWPDPATTEPTLERQDPAA